jgi:hypothetical protein
MSCDDCGVLMMDILYGEEVSPRQALEFFKHLSDCPSCEKEYLEFVQTREVLAEWKPEEATELKFDLPQIAVSRSAWRTDWWPLVQKVAAVILIAAGAISLTQWIGLWPRPNATVSEIQLAEMVHDLMVERQVEDWRVIGAALLSLKEELETKNRVEMQTVYQDMFNLEQRYVKALEDNNRQVQTLLNR